MANRNDEQIHADLTDKQKAFVQGILEGKTQYQAYIDAYDAKTQRRNSIDNMASKELAKPAVKAYLDDMRARKQAKAVFTAYMTDEDKRALIAERIEVCRQTGNDTAIRGYLDILNKMDGVYINLSKDVSDDKNALEGLSTDDLKRLLDTPKES